MNNNKLQKSPLGGFRGLLPLLLAVLLCFNACSDWLDVVPEGVATIDMAFNSRVETFKYLGSCYSYMPRNGNPASDPAMLGGDEMWTFIDESQKFFEWYGLYYAQGMQNATAPLFDYWGSLYQGLRDCNIFLDNVDKTPDLPEWERNQWVAEVKVLKAYYHFYLVQMYGPIPLIRENLPMDVDVSTVKVVREPVDDCFQYIVDLLDEAITNDFLPQTVLDVSLELGRITKPVAMALKAKVLVTAASPLFNGNSEQATLKNKPPDNRQLFNTTPDPAKWQKAVVACKEAIEACRDADMELHTYRQGINRHTDTINTQLSLREAFTQRWNSEIIWANTQSICDGGTRGMQTYVMPTLNPAIINAYNRMVLGVPMKMAAMFYTDHGVPLTEDNTRDAANLYQLRTGKSAEKQYVKTGYVTIDMHFDREPRFYAWVGFDGGIWYGQGRDRPDDDFWTLELRYGGLSSWIWSTGYLPKKYVPYTNVITSATVVPSSTPYPWPIMRLSDLYLLYAEAINEAEGSTGTNSAEMFKYIDLVRERAGLKGVRESWDTYTNSSKYNNQSGMREIIQQERMIELCFEGHRFWDVRRWKTAPKVYHNNAIDGWNYFEGNPDAYYTRRTLYTQKFGIRDYFWPIRNSDITNNPNLVQNIGW